MPNFLAAALLVKYKAGTKADPPDTYGEWPALDNILTRPCAVAASSAARLTWHKEAMGNAGVLASYKAAVKADRANTYREQETLEERGVSLCGAK